MELFTLLYNSATTGWVRDNVVEGWSSLIWTERYRNPGEFELRSYDIDAVKAALPEDIFVTLRESREVMMVESVNIEKRDGQEEIVVKGHSLEVFAKNRALDTGIVRSDMPDDRRFITTPANMALRTLKEMTEIDQGYEVSSSDLLPGTTTVGRVSDLYNYGTRSWYPNKWTGQMYDRLMDILNPYHLGIKTERPPDSDPQGKIKFVVYTGRNLTTSQTKRDPIIFRVDSGDISEAKYLWDSTNYKNVAYVRASTTAKHFKVVYPEGVSPMGGRARRVLQVMATDITDDDLKEESTTAGKTLLHMN